MFWDMLQSSQEPAAQDTVLMKEKAGMGPSGQAIQKTSLPAEGKIVGMNVAISGGL